MSFGLSLDALKYSLGYIDMNGNYLVNVENVTSARKEFYDFFEKNNFTAFSDYLTSIAIDLSIDKNRTDAEFYSRFETAAHCTRCDHDGALKKLYMNGVMCY